MVKVLRYGNIRQKKHEKLEKYQRLREELEKMCKMKENRLSGNRTLGAVSHKLSEWLQQIPGRPYLDQSRRLQSLELQRYVQNPQTPRSLVRVRVRNVLYI